MALAVKALFFDVFGTLVDWRSSIAREAEALLKPKGLALDFPAFADAWRGEYQGAMEEVRAGRIAFCKLDVLHRRNLELTLKRFGVADLSEDDKRKLNLAWHRLDAWPDVARGLVLLKRNYLLAPVSNGNISLMVDLARRNAFPWNAILGAEIAGDYKPKPRVLSRCRRGIRPCAASLHDGGGPFQRPCRRRCARSADGACGAEERAWAGPR